MTKKQNGDERLPFEGFLVRRAWRKGTWLLSLNSGGAEASLSVLNGAEELLARKFSLDDNSPPNSSIVCSVHSSSAESKTYTPTHNGIDDDATVVAGNCDLSLFLWFKSYLLIQTN